jgi:tetratricopeptide (TPR) repeat protein
LSQIAGTFRTRVGESLATVERHDTPLAEATTPSLEALKAYSAGARIVASGANLGAAAPLLKRAIDIDGRFAMAYASLGFVYGVIGEGARAIENNSKAYELRDRVSDREKFFITATYQLMVTGNLEEALQTCELWMRTYPRDMYPYPFLGSFVYPTLGQFDKGIEVASRTIARDPDFAIGYLQLAFNYQFANRLQDAERTFRQAAERKLTLPEFVVQRYDLAFVENDRAGMDREVALSHRESDAEEQMTAREGFVLAYSGHRREAAAKSVRAADLAQQAAEPGRGALWRTGAALREAFFGDASAATREAAAALDLSTDRDSEYGAAVALALAGESSRSHLLATDLVSRFPEDSSVRFSYLPTIRALVALDHKDAAQAVEVLQAGARFDLGTPPCSAVGLFGSLYPVYVRGLAYLALHDGPKAAAEFRKILDRRSIVVSDPMGAVARLQLGRALALSGDPRAARAAYDDFLTLWKDADADIPILVNARAEYAALP